MKVLPHINAICDGDIANPEGSISELCACWRWKREQGRAHVHLLTQGWGRAGCCHRTGRNQAVFSGVSQDLEQLCKWLLAEGWMLHHWMCKTVKVSVTAAFSRSGHGMEE